MNRLLMGIACALIMVPAFAGAGASIAPPVPGNNDDAGPLPDEVTVAPPASGAVLDGNVVQQLCEHPLDADVNGNATSSCGYSEEWDACHAHWYKFWDVHCTHHAVDCEVTCGPGFTPVCDRDGCRCTAPVENQQQPAPAPE